MVRATRRRVEGERSFDKDTNSGGEESITSLSPAEKRRSQTISGVAAGAVKKMLKRGSTLDYSKESLKTTRNRLSSSTFYSSGVDVTTPYTQPEDMPPLCLGSKSVNELFAILKEVCVIIHTHSVWPCMVC